MKLFLKSILVLFTIVQIQAQEKVISGFKGSNTWITLAEKQNIGWWITSALESNVGLNAIAQYTYLKEVTMPQGLGTGSLFTNNISSPLTVKNGTLQYNTNLNWDFNF